MATHGHWLCCSSKMTWLKVPALSQEIVPKLFKLRHKLAQLVLFHSELRETFPQMRGRKWPLNVALSGFALQFIRAVCVSRVLAAQTNSWTECRTAECQSSTEGSCWKCLNQTSAQKKQKTTAHLWTRIPHKPVCSSDLLQDFDE